MIPAHRLGQPFLQGFGRGEGKIPLGSFGGTGPGRGEGFLDFVEVEVIGLPSQGGERLADPSNDPRDRSGTRQNQDMRAADQRAGHFSKFGVARIFRHDSKIVPLAVAME